MAVVVVVTVVVAAVVVVVVMMALVMVAVAAAAVVLIQCDKIEQPQNCDLQVADFHLFHVYYCDMSSMCSSNYIQPVVQLSSYAFQCV